MSIGYREDEVRQLVEVAGLTSGSRGSLYLSDRPTNWIRVRLRRY